MQKRISREGAEAQRTRRGKTDFDRLAPSAFASAFVASGSTDPNLPAGYEPSNTRLRRYR